MAKRLRIHIDGGSRGNPGPAAVGMVLFDLDEKKTLLEAGYHLGQATNNVAEYQGLCRALQQAIALGASQIQILSDSQLMVRQVLGQYRVKSEDLKPLYAQAMTMLEGFGSGNWSIEHVYREKNARADELANLAMDFDRDVIIDPSAGPGASLADASEVHSYQAICVESPSGEHSCPAKMSRGMSFRFGLTVPGGMCLHAAAAVLEVMLKQDDGSNAPSAPKRVCCGKCRAVMTIG